MNENDVINSNSTSSNFQKKLKQLIEKRKSNIMEELKTQIQTNK